MNQQFARWIYGLTGAVLAVGLLGCGKTYEEEAPPPRTFTLAAGTQLMVTPTGGFTPNANQVGDRFTGVLAEPLIVEGTTVAPQGSPVVGQIVGPAAGDVEASAKTPKAAKKAQAAPPNGVELTELTVHGGQAFSISTAPIYTAEAMGAAPKAAPKAAEKAAEEPQIQDSDVLTFTLDEAAEVSMTVELESQPE